MTEMTVTAEELRSENRVQRQWNKRNRCRVHSTGGRGVRKYQGVGWVQVSIFGWPE